MFKVGELVYLNGFYHSIRKRGGVIIRYPNTPRKTSIWGIAKTGYFVKDESYPIPYYVDSDDVSRDMPKFNRSRR
jgi:hypothetical protein